MSTATPPAPADPTPGFLSPGPPSPGVGPLPAFPPPVPAPAFRPLRGLTLAVVVMLCLGALYGVATAAVSMSARDFFLRVRDRPGTVTEAEGARIDMLTIGSGLMTMVVYLTTAVLVLVWLWKVRTNLTALGRDGDLRWRQGWVIGGWFVPFANLVIPCRVVNEIEQASRPPYDPERGPERWHGTHPALALWWTMWLVTGVADRLDMIYLRKSGALDPNWTPTPRSLTDVATEEAWATVSGVTFALGALLLLVLVRRIIRGQHRHAEAQGLAPAGSIT